MSKKINNQPHIEWVKDIFEYRSGRMFDPRHYTRPYVILTTAELVLYPHKDGNDVKVLLDSTWGRKEISEITHEDVMRLLCKVCPHYIGPIACEAPIYVRRIKGWEV